MNVLKNENEMKSLYSSMANYHKDFINTFDLMNDKFIKNLSEISINNHQRSIEVYL